MKKIFLLFFLCFITYFINAQVIINEVQVDAGNHENTGGDWIELKNIGTTVADLSCWSITNGGSVIITIPGGLMLDSGQYLLIGNASKLTCLTCDYKSLNSVFTLNIDGYGPGSGAYANTIFLNTDLSSNGGCSCLTGSGNFNNGNGTGDRIILLDFSGTIVDGMHYAGGNYYGSGPVNVNLPASPTCGVSTTVLPPVTDPVFNGRIVCNDLSGCNSSFARLPDGNNGAVVTYDQSGNLACSNCLLPCTLAATNTASTDLPTPGLSNTLSSTTWSATLNGSPFTTTSTNMTVCDATPLTFSYQVNHFTNASLLATQASGNLGSYVTVNGANPTAFTTATFNGTTGITNLSSTVTPPNGTTVYTFVWGDGNSNCITCPGSPVLTTPNNLLLADAECYVSRTVTVTRENSLSGTPVAVCSIPGTITVNGAGGTNIRYTLQKQSVASGPFNTIAGPFSSNIIGGIFDDDADPALPNYRVLVSSVNTVCINPAPLIVSVPNGCLGNPACPKYVTSGTGAPSFLPSSGSNVCANGNVQFSVDITGICTTGQVEVKYSHDPSFDPYTAGTLLGTAGTTVGATPPTTTATGKVFINEFVVRPAQGTCTGTPDGVNPNSGEWVELYNAGPGNVDISGWIIADGDWTGTIPAGTMLNSGLHYLIGGGGTFCSSGVQPDLNLETCNCATVVSPQDMMNLTNGGEQLALFDCTGTFRDGVLWGTSGQLLPDTTANIAPAAGCGNYLVQKSVNLPVPASFAASGTIASPNSGKYRDASNNWVTTAATAITPKAANPGGNWNGSTVSFGTQCPPPPVSSTITVTIPDTCAQFTSTPITLKAIYKPQPISPCLSSDVTASASYNIPPCETLTLSGNGEYCAPATAPVSISASGVLSGNHTIHLSNGTITDSIGPVTGNGPFTGTIDSSGIWTISSITAPPGSCPPKKTGTADITIHPIPSISNIAPSASFCYQYGFDLSSIEPSLVTVPPTSTFLWYDSLTGGSPISPLVNPPVNTTYYVAASTGAPSNCEQIVRTPVILNIDPIPLPPSVTSNGVTATFTPQTPNCNPSPCGSGLEYSVDGINWSAGPSFTASDPGWSGFGSPLNNEVFIRNAGNTNCFLNVTYFNLSIPLPTQLFQLSAHPKAMTIDLNWKTAQENQLSHFEIERSSNKLHFEKIGSLNALGNTAVTTPYYFNDARPLPGENYYRIKMMDIDGNFAYSTVVMATIASNSNAIDLIYPNPATNEIQVSVHATGRMKSTMRVLDITGRVVMEESLELSRGSNTQRFNIHSLAKGHYRLAFFIQGEWLSRSFIKQ